VVGQLQNVLAGMDGQVTVERDIRERAVRVVSLPQQVGDLHVCVEAGPLVEDHRARMVGMVVAVDGMRDAGVGDRRDSPQDVFSNGGRGVYCHDSFRSCHEDHLVEAVS
jgi:hypothetical protein